MYFLDIWLENGSTLQEFNRKASLCIRYAHNRMYKRRSKANQSKSTGESSENENFEVEGEVIIDEIDESIEIDEDEIDEDGK
jgi:predicted RNA-binding protein with RPS1 domain